MSTVTRIAGSFTEVAPQYDAITKSLEYFCPEWIAQNVHQFEISPEFRVLDLACGSGLNVRALHQQRAGIRAEGVDASSGMLEIARATGLYQKLYSYDLNTPLPDIPSDTFDLVMVFSVLHLLSDVPTCLSECHRVLKPGGTLWATFRPYEADDPGTPAQTVRRQGGGKVTGYSAAQILHMARKARLRLTALDPVIEYISGNGFPVPCYLLQARKTAVVTQPQASESALDGAQ